jgi:hypothetical protein
LLVGAQPAEEAMHKTPSPRSEPLSPSGLLSLDQVCDCFEAAWRAGKRPTIEEYLVLGVSAHRPELFRELLAVELACRKERGERPTPEEYQVRFPTYAADVKVALQQGNQPPTIPHQPPASATPHEIIAVPASGVRLAAALPERLGRYRVVACLGSGGFGAVYRGYDDELKRDVAIKVPHKERTRTAADAEAYLTEARVLASLDHPHIVPVFDLGRTDDGACYIVSKFIEGSDLATRIKKAWPTLLASVQLVVTVADALHHAHHKGLVHRDVKPANILIGAADKPFVADFGLALKEEDFGKNAGLCGTPAYMSYKHLAEGQPGSLAPLENVLAEQGKPEDSLEAKGSRARRQANIGAALIVMGQADHVWQLLKHSEDPTRRSYLIDRLAVAGADPQVLLRRFYQEKDVSIKRALLLSLAEFGPDHLPPVERQNAIPQLLQVYKDDPDPGLHGVADWLLRQWKADAKLKAIDKELISRIAVYCVAAPSAAML